MNTSPQESLSTQMSLSDIELQYIEKTIENAKKAQESILGLDNQQLNLLISDLATVFRNQLTDLCEMEIQETKIGNAIDKEHKLSLVVNEVLFDLLSINAQGKIKQINEYLVEYASPVGIIFAVIPLTNPVSNSLFKTLLSIKTRNALIVSYPRAATNLGMYTIQMIQTVLKKHKLPIELIQSVPQPSSREQVKCFMSHPGIDLILATGGPDLVKTAYSSGTPAYGVGPGNVPVFVSSTANVEQAAADIVKGKSYDNGIVCGSESNLIISSQMKESFIRALEKNGAAVLNEKEKAVACEKFFDPITYRVKKEFIGVHGKDLANVIGVTRQEPIKLIIIPAELTSMLWLSKEKMTPILTMYSVDNVEEGIATAKQLLGEGIGHTAVIHSQDIKEIHRYAEEIPTGRLLVNTPATYGMLGVSTALEVSFMLGSGSYGGNITTDAINWRHFVNIKRLAFDTEKPIPANPSLPL